MKIKKQLFFLLGFIFLIVVSCNNIENKNDNKNIKNGNKKIIPAAELPEKYLPLLKDKNVVIVANQTSQTNGKHLLDFLVSENVNVKKVFALEHGFRGNIDRGKHFDNTKDEKTGIPIVALFGKNRKPKPEHLNDVDVVLFDIQDVGVRFFTYISSMHNVMEACAENNKEIIILDRPNPLGDYFDGPVLEKEYKSFVGMHKIPVVHGLTVGELAKMINGEFWLKSGKQAKLTVIKIQNYKHSSHYSLPIKPSPNLPTDISIRLYPSLCFFEATSVSIGRGTKFPFQVIAYPDTNFGDFTFTPKDISGMQMNPLHENKKCYGVDLRNSPLEIKFTLKYFFDFYNKFENKDEFISRKRWFNLLAGNSKLLEKIESGMSEIEIRKTWENDLDKYKIMRKKYLLYPEN